MLVLGSWSNISSRRRFLGDSETCEGGEGGMDMVLSGIRSYVGGIVYEGVGRLVMAVVLAVIGVLNICPASFVCTVSFLSKASSFFSILGVILPTHEASPPSLNHQSSVV